MSDPFRVRYSVAFKRLNKGEVFTLNGNTYTKRSTRTAHLTEYDRTFYIGQNQTVNVGQDVRNDIVRDGR